ncbi:MAG: GDSL-type esterase/lipase family protein [Acidobacteria bacterium]|nr:GDSL-type esterase/lipase family protein [Acidobacteriota bacterium]
MPGISGDSVFSTNSNGIRGDELTSQHSYRIMAIGGSTTLCLYLDQSETWTSLLQENLNRHNSNHQVWVGNGGLSGMNANHHVVALQHLPLKELKVDTVIVLTGINDLIKRLTRDKDYAPISLDNPTDKRDLLAETFTGTYDAYQNDVIYKRTAIWQLLRRTKRIMTMSAAHIEDEHGSIYVTWRAHRQQASEIRNELPDLSSALEEYARNINKMIDIAQEKSAHLIFMTQPTMWKQDLPENLASLLWFGGIGDFQKEPGKPYYSVVTLEKGIKAYNETLLQVCQNRQIDCLDLASILNKDTSVFYDDAHFNEGGARKIAQALSEYMLERGHNREMIKLFHQ